MSEHRCHIALAKLLPLAKKAAPPLRDTDEYVDALSQAESALAYEFSTSPAEKLAFALNPWWSELLEAAKEFVHKVDTRGARSHRSYARFERAIEGIRTGK